MIYQSNPNMPPDSNFHPGSLKYRVPGNEGRMLDARRTPIRILDLKLSSGFFVVEVLDFEDRGARWELPFEKVENFQFGLGSTEATEEEVDLFTETIAHLDQPLMIPAEARQRSTTESKITSLREDVKLWLKSQSEFLASGNQLDFSGMTGPSALWRDLENYMKYIALWEIEKAFADQFVSNPYSGETVKGHCILLAELGLVSFEGKLVRNQDTFHGMWSKQRRADHILHRMAFLRELFAQMGFVSVILYRGTSFDGQPDDRRNNGFLSATFNLDVAMSHFSGRDLSNSGTLLRQPVPIERIFMTYLETAQMNRQYKEAEAVLLYNPENALF